MQQYTPTLRQAGSFEMSAERGEEYAVGLCQLFQVYRCYSRYSLS
jgi:hypothetical protein